jgi:hypothetical protein
VLRGIHQDHFIATPLSRLRLAVEKAQLNNAQTEMHANKLLG